LFPGKNARQPCCAVQSEKVLKITVPAELLNFIKTGERFIVAGHKQPDGDCIGSQLALRSALERLGKQAVACSAGPFDRLEVKPYAKFFTPVGEVENTPDTRVILVDSSSIKRTGDLESFLKGLPIAVIDHHSKFEYQAVAQKDLEQKPNFLDETKPSCTILVQAVIEELGIGITEEEAELLFLGLCTDTGFFRHLSSANGEVAFQSAARLAAAGANAKKTFNTINSGKGLNSRILLGHILARAETFFDGKLVLSYESPEETKSFGAEGRDSDSLYSLLLSVKGVEAIAIIRQESPENCVVGLRSADKIDVSSIAASLGGGGHKNAAGLSTAGTISEVKGKIMEAFAEVF